MILRGRERESGGGLYAESGGMESVKSFEISLLGGKGNDDEDNVTSSSVRAWEFIIKEDRLPLTPPSLEISFSSFSLFFFLFQKNKSVALDMRNV